MPVPCYNGWKKPVLQQQFVLRLNPESQKNHFGFPETGLIVYMAAFPWNQGPGNLVSGAGFVQRNVLPEPFRLKSRQKRMRKPVFPVCGVSKSVRERQGASARLFLQPAVWRWKKSAAAGKRMSYFYKSNFGDRPEGIISWRTKRQGETENERSYLWVYCSDWGCAW